jgi:hypothetical protein
MAERLQTLPVVLDLSMPGMSGEIGLAANKTQETNVPTLGFQRLQRSGIAWGVFRFRHRRFPARAVDGTSTEAPHVSVLESDMLARLLLEVSAEVG